MSDAQQGGEGVKPTLSPVAPPPQQAPPPPQAPPPQQAGPPPAWGYPGPVPGGPRAPYPLPQPRKGGSAFKTILLVLGVLLLCGSIVLNLFLLADLGMGLEPGAAMAMRTTEIRGGRASQTIALYSVDGIIDESAMVLFRHFHKAVAYDSNVKAVVLRVESPGGAVTASDQICEMVKDLRARGKKVVVSMGSLAASGGYYISAPADEIYAEATTITGSIGVIAGWVVLKGTLDKIGAEPIVIKSSHAQGWKDEMSMFATPHDYQRQHIREILDTMQTRFEEVVQAGRGGRLQTKQVSYTIPAPKEGEQPARHSETEPFNGKIYLADKAKELGLIDQIGYQDDAIQRAAKLARLSNERVVRYSRRLTFVEQLMQGRQEPSLKLDASLLDRLQTPRFMMLWKAD